MKKSELKELIKECYRELNESQRWTLVNKHYSLSWDKKYGWELWRQGGSDPKPQHSFPSSMSKDEVYQKLTKLGYRTS